MKKSTIIVILIVYLVSIVAIGFFGMAVKVYDEVKYVKSIEMKTEAEREDMFVFETLGKDALGNNTYKLTINFEQQHLVDGQGEAYLPLTLIPYVTYDTGDVAGEEEKIKYTINSSVDLTATGLGYVDLQQTGQLICYKESFYSFKIFVSPERSSANGTSAIIEVFVL